MVTAKKTASKPATEKAERKQSDANRRYGAALKTLRERHEEEFIDILKEKYAAEGAEYQPRLTAEQKAEKAKAEKLARAQAKIAALHAEFPELAQQGPAPTHNWETVDEESDPDLIEP